MGFREPTEGHFGPLCRFLALRGYSYNGMPSRTTHPLITVGAEQASVVAFLHHDVSDAGLILLLKADTGLSDGQQLIIQHLRWKSTKLKASSIQVLFFSSNV